MTSIIEWLLGATAVPAGFLVLSLVMACTKKKKYEPRTAAALSRQAPSSGAITPVKHHSRATPPSPAPPPKKVEQRRVKSPDKKPRMNKERHFLNEDKTLPMISVRDEEINETRLLRLQERGYFEVNVHETPRSEKAMRGERHRHERSHKSSSKHSRRHSEHRRGHHDDEEESRDKRSDKKERLRSPRSSDDRKKRRKKRSSPEDTPPKQRQDFDPFDPSELDNTKNEKSRLRMNIEILRELDKEDTKKNKKGPHEDNFGYLYSDSPAFRRHNGLEDEIANRKGKRTEDAKTHKKRELTVEPTQAPPSLVAAPPPPTPEEMQASRQTVAETPIAESTPLVPSQSQKKKDSSVYERPAADPQPGAEELQPKSTVKTNSAYAQQ